MRSLRGRWAGGRAGQEGGPSSRQQHRPPRPAGGPQPENKQRKNHSQCLLWPNSVPGAVVNFGHELFRLLLTTPCEVDRNVISDR